MEQANGKRRLRGSNPRLNAASIAVVAAGLTVISAVSHFAAYIAGSVMCAGGLALTIWPIRESAGPLPMAADVAIAPRVRTVAGPYVQFDTVMALEIQAKGREGLVNCGARLMSIEHEQHLEGPKPPIRIYWAPSGNVTETVASGAVDALELARVEPDGIAILRTPDHERAWAYPDGVWTVEVQLTADGYRAGRITASFSLAKSRPPAWVGEPAWL